MSIVVKICKADPSGNFPEVIDQTIIIANKIPNRMSLKEAGTFYEKQASMINEALFESLPQGTYDRLGIKFMQEKILLYQGRTDSAF